MKRRRRRRRHWTEYSSSGMSSALFPFFFMSCIKNQLFLYLNTELEKKMYIQQFLNVKINIFLHFIQNCQLYYSNNVTKH